MTKKQTSRIARLASGRVPKWIRVYDMGTDGPVDRYTVIFTGRIRERCRCSPYLAMDANPFHPQGFGQHGESDYPCDTLNGGWAPAIGRKHETLGKRINFLDLPVDCQKLVWQDYAEIWGIPNYWVESPAVVLVNG